MNLFHFNRANIDAIGAFDKGVYGIYDSARRPIYIGRGYLHDRLLAHLGGDNRCISGSHPMYFFIERYLSDSSAVRREKELILQLSPNCNLRVG